mmetsp:Transcript_56690/g.123453  ORF Transcript_56690/g.123453 Transcript_56690/m.123453 type:complete len:319 (-) Transcript_56690:422-1378(-)
MPCSQPAPQSGQWPARSPCGQGWQILQNRCSRPCSQPRHWPQLHSARPCSHGLHSEHHGLSFPCGQPLHSAQFPRRCPCGQELHSAQASGSRPWGHARHSRQLARALPWRQPLQMLQLSRSLPWAQAPHSGQPRADLPWGQGLHFGHRSTRRPCSQPRQRMQFRRPCGQRRGRRSALGNSPRRTRAKRVSRSFRRGSAGALVGGGSAALSAGRRWGQTKNLSVRLRAPLSSGRHSRQTRPCRGHGRLRFGRRPRPSSPSGPPESGPAQGSPQGPSAELPRRLPGCSCQAPCMSSDSGPGVAAAAAERVQPKLAIPARS